MDTSMSANGETGCVGTGIVRADACHPAMATSSAARMHRYTFMMNIISQVGEFWPWRSGENVEGMGNVYPERSESPKAMP